MESHGKALRRHEKEEEDELFITINFGSGYFLPGGTN